MGNQLTGIAPSQIYPVEHYLTEQSEVKFDLSLGSTRFFKVARAHSQEGLVVVKVFAIHDPTLPLQPYKERLDDIRSKLASAVNCLPFHRVVVTEKAYLIIREYVKYSLYDRISTRPFLTNIEKRWITFQVLCALHQCHKVGVCHGDIKLENITVTAWNWVMLMDFASFKPTLLPDRNPADYSYFFDTSRRRTCYIAPERFINTQANEQQGMTVNETPCNSGELNPAMDIFSAGCALIELWNEGNSPFDLSQLLGYRSKEYYPNKYLDKIEDPALKELLSSMIQHDPEKRLSAEIYLSRERGKLFPEYFYSFLQPYMQIFSAPPMLSPDEKILRLKNDKEIFKMLHAKEKDEDLKEEDDGLVIVTTLVTSCIRGLHDCVSKMEALEILVELAKHANDETILDRIMPYIMFLAHDVDPLVKESAIKVITECLNMVKHISNSDANIFPEYILSGLATLAVDSDANVRTAYARHIASLAEIALRFLEQTQTEWCEKTGFGKNKDVPYINYEMELLALHEMIQQSVSALLTDSHAIVKQTLIENGITKLCLFFGKQKANDIILSHMITFLNDKEDMELRGAFFECVVEVSAYIGWHCSFILIPLMLQGLTDSSELVTIKSIRAMASLAELGLLTKQGLCELIKETCNFLVHPNVEIVKAVAGFLSTAAKTLSLLDIQCKIMPFLEPYMKYPLIQIQKPELLEECLVSPIPRSIFDDVLKYSDIDAVIITLNDRQNARLLAQSDKIINYAEVRPQNSTNNLFRRLIAEGLNESIEERLLMMEAHLRKIHKHRLNAETLHKKHSHDLQSSSGGRFCNFNLSDSMGNFNSQRKSQRLPITSPIDQGPNSEWNLVNAEMGALSELATPPCMERGGSGERNIEYKRSKCSVDLSKLISKQQDHYTEIIGQEWFWKPPLLPPGWKLRGRLVAHLHEHRGTVTKLASLGERPLFASSSSDGCIRIWDLAKIEGKNIANRSKHSYRMPGGHGVTGMAVCENGLSLGAAANDGSLVVLKLEPTIIILSMVHDKQLSNEESSVVDLHYMDSGRSSILTYATVNGNINGWDTRTPEISWKLHYDIRLGIISSYCIDPYNNWLAAVMSNGRHVAWDLRFHIPICGQSYSGASVQATKPRKVIAHPIEPSCVISTMPGNNEVSIWNLETEQCQMTLWGSDSPPSTSSSVNNNYVSAMYGGTNDHSGFVLTGGTDKRIRYWDLAKPAESFLAVPAPNDPLLGGGVMNFHSRAIEGVNVIYTSETPNPNKTSGRDDAPRAGPEPPSPAHRDCITDIAVCKGTQSFMVTSSRDGVIKVWK